MFTLKNIIHVAVVLSFMGLNAAIKSPVHTPNAQQHHSAYDFLTVDDIANLSLRELKEKIEKRDTASKRRAVRVLGPLSQFSNEELIQAVKAKELVDEMPLASLLPLLEERLERARKGEKLENEFLTPELLHAITTLSKKNAGNKTVRKECAKYKLVCEKLKDTGVIKAA